MKRDQILLLKLAKQEKRQFLINHFLQKHPANIRYKMIDRYQLGVYTTCYMKTMLIDIPRECVAYNLVKTARHMAAFYRKAIAPSGLQGNQFPQLLAIKLAQPVSVSRLAHILELDRTTLSRNLKRLQDKEYITMTATDDRRIRNVSLSDHGEEILQTALPFWNHAQHTIIEQFGTEKWNSMLQDLKALEQLIA
jgi:DNA-binding MarR family transcriptional regulator